MKKILLASAAVVAFLSGPALAADLPVKARPAPAPVVAAIYSWTGFYIGIDGGWGWGRHERLTTGPLGGFANDYESRGWLFGGHFGYNWQVNQIVFGLEGDAHWARIRGDDLNNSVSCPPPGTLPCGGTTDETTYRFLASARGRLGVAWNQVLLFATGGWAWANLNHNNPAGVPVDNSVNRNGPTVGGGLQYAITPNISIGAEYRHYWFGTYSLAPVGLVPFEVRNRLDTVTGRLTYQFGGPVRAAY